MPHPESVVAIGERVRWAFLAALVLSLSGAIVNLKNETAAQASMRDPYLVNMQPVRLAGILESVPANAVMGYVTDLEAGSTAAQASFNGVRYALAPRLLVPGAGHEWVLGNYSRPADFAAAGRALGLELVRDFGNGAVLYRRLGR